MSRPIPSTHGVYIPGTGITITRANIADEQLRRIEANRSAATPEEIVMEFVTYSEQNSKHFKQGNRYQKLVARATAIMRR